MKQIGIYTIVLFSLISVCPLPAQVGINTTAPRGIFHIDGLKNTPGTGTPTAAQTSDDVIVTSSGQLGIGTISPVPASKLDINGKIKITDGTQAGGYNLLSDVNGLAHWGVVKNKMKLATTLGAGISLSLTSANLDKRIPTGGYIDLLPGPSLIMGSLYAYVSPSATVAGLTNEQLQIRYMFSDNPTTGTLSSNFEYLNAPTGWGYITVMQGSPGNIAGGSGYWVINNKTSSTLRMYMYAMVSSTITNGSLTLFNIGNLNAYENVVIIVPIDKIGSL